jgi:hypothetical protein
LLVKTLLKQVALKTPLTSFHKLPTSLMMSKTDPTKKYCVKAIRSKVASF